MRSEAAKLIAAAGQAELETANRRYHAIESYLHGNVPIEEPLPMGLPPARSLRRWRAQYIAAQAACGCGFAELLPDRRSQGNRNPKLPYIRPAELSKLHDGVAHLCAAPRLSAADHRHR